MKKALIIFISISIIFTLIFFVFVSDYDTKKVGLATVRYKKHEVREKLGEEGYAWNIYNFDDHSFQLVIDVNIYNNGKDNSDGFIPSGNYVVNGYISWIADDNINPGGLISFTRDPFLVKCHIYLDSYDNDTDLGGNGPDGKYIYLQYYEVDYNAFTFFGMTNNCVSIYWETSMSFDEVEDVIDFGVYILDFIKSLFVLIGKIFYTVGYFF